MDHQAARLVLACTLAAIASCSGETARTDEASAAPRGVAAGAPHGRPLDLDALVQRARLAYRPADGGFTAEHETYSARASVDGSVTIAARAPRHEGGPTADALRLETVSVARGDRSLASGPGTATPREDGGLRTVRGEVVEHLENRNSGVEQSWVFDRRPVGSGDLIVRVRASGLPFAGETDQGLHFAGASAPGLRYGTATWIDARGRRTALRPRYEGGEIVLDVPGPLVDGAAYPAVLDPTVSPEIALDTPVSSDDLGLRPAAAFDGATYLVVWTADVAGSGPNDLVGARVSSNGTVLDPVPITITDAIGVQDDAAVGFDGTDFVVVWSDHRNDANGADIYGARVTPAGTVLDLGGVAVSTAPEDQLLPAIACESGACLVVWEDYRSSDPPGLIASVYGARVGSAGAVLDPAGFAVSTVPGAFTPALGWGGSDYLVVWTDTRNGPFMADIYGARVSPAAAVLDPGGFAVSTAPSNQREPAIAHDGTGFFVAWEDYRNGDGLPSVFGDVFGARVTAAGAVLDPAGVAVSTAANGQAAPAVSFDGSGYLVAWRDYRNDANAIDADVYGARVSTAAVVADPAGISLSDGKQAFALAGGSGGHLLAWQGGSGLPDGVFATRVSAAGAVLDAPSLGLSRLTNSQTAASVAYDGASYLVVWVDGRNGDNDIFGVRVAPDGALLDPVAIPIAAAPPSFAVSTAVAHGGAGYLVAWSDGDLHAVRVSSAGEVLDGVPIDLSTAQNGQTAPAIATDGSDFFVVWADSRADEFSNDVFGARVTGEGVVLDPSGIPISAGGEREQAPAVAYDGTGFLVAWADWRNGPFNSDVYAARVSVAGVVLDPSGVAVSMAANDQGAPSVASDGAGSLVAWVDSRSVDAMHVYGARVTPGGEVIDPSGIQLTSGDEGQSSVALSHLGTSYLLVYGDAPNDAADLLAARVGADGAVLDPAGFAIETEDAIYAAAVASDQQGGALVAYCRRDAALKSTRVRAHLVGAGDGGAGGAGGAGGGGGSAGGGGSGGAPPGNGGGGPAGGDASGIADAADDGGCGCRTAGSASSGAALLALAALAAAGAARRRTRLTGRGRGA